MSRPGRRRRPSTPAGTPSPQTPREDDSHNWLVDDTEERLKRGETGISLTGIPRPRVKSDMKKKGTRAGRKRTRKTLADLPPYARKIFGPGVKAGKYPLAAVLAFVEELERETSAWKQALINEFTRKRGSR